MLFHHEIWRDEWQAWLIARDSNSLAELYENVKYEGHPTLWHLLLYGLTKITHDPWIMQLLHLIISMAAAALILFKAPFAAWQKIGLVFGYFFLFEYTVLSRSYGLSLLLVLLFLLVVFQRKALLLMVSGHAFFYSVKRTFMVWSFRLDWHFGCCFQCLEKYPHPGFISDKPFCYAVGRLLFCKLFHPTTLGICSKTDSTLTLE